MKKLISGVLCASMLLAALPLAACKSGDATGTTTVQPNSDKPGGTMNNGKSNATISECSLRI